MLQKRLLLAIVAANFAATPAFAIDEVVRQSDRSSVRGTIATISKTELTVEAAGRSTTIPATDVASVRWDGEPPQLNLTRTRESNGDLEFALESYRELLGQATAEQRNLKADISFLIARTLARQAITDPAGKDAAVKALDEYINANPDSFRHYSALDWLGRVQVAAGDAAAARSTYARLAEAPLPELKMAAQNALARIKLDQDDLAGALADFDAVLKQPASDPATTQQRYAAQLGRAIVLQRQGNHDEALKALNEVIEQASPDDAPVQAEAFLRKGEILEAAGRDKDALLAYLHVDILFSGESALHAEALYHLVRLWPVVGKAERSADARRKLMDQYPASEWAKKL